MSRHLKCNRRALVVVAAVGKWESRRDFQAREASVFSTAFSPDGVFSVVPRGEAKFVQHHLFRLTICFLIPPIDGPEILPFPLAPQVNPPQIVSGSGYILNGATLSPPVTF